MNKFILFVLFSTIVIQNAFSAPISTVDYHLDACSWSQTSGEVIDSSGNNINGTSTVGTNISTTAQVVRSGFFEGYTSANHSPNLVISDNDLLDNTSKLTMMLWFYPTVLDGKPRGLLSKRVTYSGSNANDSYSIFFYTNNKIFIDIDGTNNRFNIDDIFNVNEWHHIAVVYDGSLTTTNRVKVYIDSLLSKTATETSTSIPNYASNLYIATLNANYSQGFKGNIDEVKIFRSSLTQIEIQEIYNKESRVITPCATAKGLLKDKTWSLITFPCDTGSHTIEELLTPSLQTYGDNDQWIAYKQDGSNYNGKQSSYIPMAATETVTKGQAYWIIADTQAINGTNEVIWSVDGILGGLALTSAIDNVNHANCSYNFKKVVHYPLPASSNSTYKRVMIGSPLENKYNSSDLFISHNNSLYYDIDNSNNTTYIEGRVYITDTDGNYQALDVTTPGFSDIVEPGKGLWIKLKQSDTNTNEIDFPLFR